MGENSSTISESFLGSYRDLTIIGGETEKKRHFRSSKYAEISKVNDHEKYIADLTNRVESQEITINQLEQKINDAELSVEDMRLRSPAPNQPVPPRTYSESSVTSTRSESTNEELLREHSLKLQVKTQTMREIGGAGHYSGDDRDLGNGGRRNDMSDEGIKKIFEIMSLGQTEVNFKTYWNKNYNVSAFGYTLKINSYWEGVDGDCEFYHFWLKHQVMPIRFKVTAEQIHEATGRVYDKQELESAIDGKCHKVQLKEVRGHFVRWNVTLLPLYS
ncbi:Oidioi.mRNA.OKI2018_I69.chr2.g7240.t1.cds [Oikopleura dioica]|uniref:Oidioi.mRNA.OKI2018_I69.chr2.g7240.t1.cds n=1 Tax=Oikopleura dioica TaxID=34765 RepID=A0ABN7TAA0_OIKDI|nr:Oidioi.mRNA.OKI2018_I69.chr2.g7240.t1.cds [Oikopleura dioica]